VGQGQDARSGAGDQEHQIAEELALPPVKIHCSILAEDAIKAAVADYKKHAARRRIMAVTLERQGGKHVANYMAKRGKGVGLRLGVRTSGCSGMAYKLEFVDEVSDPRTWSSKHGVKVLIDAKSLPYLDGMELDYAREGLNEGLQVQQSERQGQCGCGESFNV
jgi:iron-sulfur cluster assembly protein